MYLARYSPFTASADSLSVLREWKAAAFGRLLQTRSRAMQNKPGCASDQASEEQKVSFEQRGGQEKVCGSRPTQPRKRGLAAPPFIIGNNGDR
jgi:hypothetical protein